MPFLMGIDAGSHATTAALSNEALRMLATATAGAADFETMPAREAIQALESAVGGALTSAQVDPAEVTALCVGMAGATSRESTEQMYAVLARLLPAAAVELQPEAALFLEAEFPAQPGLVCVAGRGSVGFGRNDRGVSARSGGWGPIVSDEGSAPWIGQRAVAHCLRAMDMGRSSGLIASIMNHWHIATREQLVLRCHQARLEEFADLFTVVLGSSDTGDALASEVLTAAGGELARTTQVVIRRLWVGRAPLEIALCGPVFQASPHIANVFGNVVRNERPEVRTRLGEQPACLGALRLARAAKSAAK